MALSLSVKDGRDMLGWEVTFAALGIERYRRLLPYAGVPAPLTRKPAGLTNASRFFWESVWQHHPRDTGPQWTRETFTEQLLAQYNENSRQAILSLLEGTFALLIESYGESLSKELYEWADRNFVDQQQAARWDVWNRLFLRLINESSLRYPLLPILLPDTTIKKVKQVIRQCSSFMYVEEESDLAEVFAAADQIPLSPEERRMIAMTPVYPDDSDQIDLSLRLKLVIQREATYQAWKKIQGWLEEGEREALLQWGRRQAELMGDSAAWVTLP